MTPRVLVVDDDPDMRDLVSAALEEREYDVSAVPSGVEALRLLEARDFDAVVTDLQMSGMSGLELCSRISAIRPDLPALVLTAFGNFESAVAAIRAGAYDFITKPLDVRTLALSLERAVRFGALRQEVKRLQHVVENFRAFDEMVGQSPAMLDLYSLLDRIADSSASVLITGESGTGKELVARALHKRGRQSRGEFVAVNCSALPEALLESELFGHAKGAFTDAKGGRAGLFAKAEGGTLLLDEIGELPVGLQPKLLRALQERRIRPVGSDADVPFNARVLAATNRDLETEVAEGRFREDLYYRINVIHVDVPPLRARGSDVLQIAQTLLGRFASQSSKKVTGMTAEAAERLVTYPWPGNVRELANCIERAVALARFDQLTPEDLPPRIQGFEPKHVVVASSDPTELATLEEVERRYIAKVLEAVGGNKKKAAEVLAIDRKTLYRKLSLPATPEG